MYISINTTNHNNEHTNHNLHARRLLGAVALLECSPFSISSTPRFLLATAHRGVRANPLLTWWISEVRLEHNLNLQGWNSHVHRDFLGIFVPESLTQAMLVGTMLAGRLGVAPRPFVGATRVRSVSMISIFEFSI